jgi:hypothetical protein
MGADSNSGPHVGGAHLGEGNFCGRVNLAYAHDPADLIDREAAKDWG